MPFIVEFSWTRSMPCPTELLMLSSSISWASGNKKIIMGTGTTILVLPPKRIKENMIIIKRVWGTEKKQMCAHKNDDNCKNLQLKKGTLISIRGGGDIMIREKGCESDFFFLRMRIQLVLSKWIRIQLLCLCGSGTFPFWIHADPDPQPCPWPNLIKGVKSRFVAGSGINYSTFRTLVIRLKMAGKHICSQI